MLVIQLFLRVLQASFRSTVTGSFALSWEDSRPEHFEKEIWDIDNRTNEQDTSDSNEDELHCFPICVMK